MDIHKPLPTGWGYRPDIPDIRDFPARSVLRLRAAGDRPSTIDLRMNMPEVFDQGRIGSCVSQSVAALVWHARSQVEGRVAVPSRPFIYYASRVREGTVPIDNGQYIRTAMKVLSHEGAAPEYMWGHELDENDLPDSSWLFPKSSRWIRKPTKRVYTEAERWQTLVYYRVNSVDDMLNCLADGFPFTFGFAVYRSFYGSDGRPQVVTPMPHSTEKMLGGHAVVAVGYDDNRRMFLCRNSWGTDVQDKGHYWMPYSYLGNANLASDVWTIRDVERHGNRD